MILNFPRHEHKEDIVMNMNLQKNKLIHDGKPAPMFLGAYFSKYF